MHNTQKAEAEECLSIYSYNYFPVLLKEVDYIEAVILTYRKVLCPYVMMPLELKNKNLFLDKDQTSFHDHVTSSLCALLATVSLQPRSTINQRL